ncbi:hypothetical protein GCM10010982_34030 [Bowmanella pacifica]|uniref:Uncharacterized protein n=1 Tax=Bowmanella pacifica TaxID=502051 RepID=A0A917Z3J2_9ALTE|nr:hypothetical protein GCM10010982_34030 [Bowmanella pacifica]
MEADSGWRHIGNAGWYGAALFDVALKPPNVWGHRYTYGLCPQSVAWKHTARGKALLNSQIGSLWWLVNA